MNVKVAETAGFCFGVQRAVDRVYELIGSDAAPIYTLGPIIHNEEVVSDLEKKGVAVICEKDLGSLKGGTVDKLSFFNTTSQPVPVYSG